MNEFHSSSGETGQPLTKISAATAVVAAGPPCVDAGDREPVVLDQRGVGLCTPCYGTTNSWVKLESATACQTYEHGSAPNTESHSSPNGHGCRFALARKPTGAPRPKLSRRRARGGPWRSSARPLPQKSRGAAGRGAAELTTLRQRRVQKETRNGQRAEKWPGKRQRREVERRKATRQERELKVKSERAPPSAASARALMSKPLSPSDASSCVFSSNVSEL